VSPAPLLPPPPPPSPFAEGHDYTLQLQQPHHHVHCSLNRDSLTPLSGLRPLPRHGADKSTVASYRSTPDERGGMEAFIDGMPMMVLPPATLRSQQESGAPINTITTPATAGPAGAHMHAHGGHHHGNHHSGQNRLRDSSLGSSGGVQRSPFAKARPAGLSTKLATGQSREFVYTSSSSLYTSTPQTLTSTASDPLLLSFSSANLAAPMMSNGSNNNMNMSNCCGVNSSGGGSGDGTMNSAPSAQVTTPTPAPNVTTTDGFVMKPDAETVQSLPRGKVPRMPGCSMRDWTAHLAAKEADNRRGEQQQQQQQRHGSGSAPSSQSHQRTGIYSLFSGPSSSSSAGTLSAFSLPASQHSPSSRTALPRITPQEVAKHNTPDDLWIVIRNVVYDCTEFQRFHPGGEKLLLACAGRDATEVYDRFHVWVSCESFMGPYAVGVLAPPPPHKGGG
jgi:cytochrome b involved in lipid metabolism